MNSKMGFMGDGRSEVISPAGRLVPKIQNISQFGRPQQTVRPHSPCSAVYVRRAFNMRVPPDPFSIRGVESYTRQTVHVMSLDAGFVSGRMD